MSPVSCYRPCSFDAGCRLNHHPNTQREEASKMAYCHFYPRMELRITYIKPSPKPRRGNHSTIRIQDTTGAAAQNPGHGACGRGGPQACVDPKPSVLATAFAYEPFHSDLLFFFLIAKEIVYIT